MQKTTIQAIIAATITIAPIAAKAELTFSGSITAGYVSGYDEQNSFPFNPVITTPHVNQSGAFVLGDFGINYEGAFEGGTAGFKIDLDVGSFEYSDPDASILDDYTLFLDLEEYGRLEFTSENRVVPWQAPFIDGNLINADENNFYGGGTYSVMTGIPGAFRGVGFAGAGNYVTKDYLKYSNKFGAVGFEAFYDPNIGGETVYGGTAASTSLSGYSEWELGISYAKPGKFKLSANVNDQEDIKLGAVIPVPSANLAFIANYERLGSTFANPLGAGPASFAVEGYTRRTAAVDWKPKDLGYFKGGVFVYQDRSTPTTTGDNSGYVVQAKFGDKKWSATFAMDDEGDFAAEGSYAFSDNLDFLVAYDAGCGASDCFNSSAPGAGAGAAPASAESIEIALRYKF